MRRKTMAVFECHCGRIHKTEEEALSCHSPLDGTKDYWLGMAEGLSDDDGFERYAEAISKQDYYSVT